MEIKFTNFRFQYRKRATMFIMKTILFLCCFTTLGLSPSNVLSQNLKITVDNDKIITVDEIFKMISDQTDLKFIYQDDLFKNSPKIKLKKGTIDANELLNNAILNANVNIELTKDNTIVIKSEPVDVNPY